MRRFTSVHDVPDLPALLAKALAIKQNQHATPEAGKHRVLGLLFFNPSLRTQMSSQRAAFNLGMNVISLNAQQSWQMEFEDGAVMDGDKVEHIREGAAVIGQYCDILGIRTFPSLTDREKDYSERVIEQFIKYCPVPVVSLESATRHPLQSLADLLTIETLKRSARPKVTLTWAPHVKALPQCVGNSFAEWMNHAEVDFTIAHPEGFELAPEFAGKARIVHNQEEALDGADFVYAKNWSAYSDYGKVGPRDPAWMLTAEKMKRTNNARFMHCLPVRRNVEVHDSVLDGPWSVVAEQAQNRTYAAQAVMSEMLKVL
jgi:N-succinyl-L-ornithine transcarbamylase